MPRGANGHRGNRIGKLLEAAVTFGVVKGGEEVGVVADLTGQCHGHCRHGVQQCCTPLSQRGIAVQAQQLRQPRAQRRRGTLPQSHHPVEAAIHGSHGSRRVAIQEPRQVECVKVDDRVADGRAGARRGIRGMPSRQEHAQRQVLDREVGAGLVSGREPASACGVVGCIDGDHGLASSSNPF